MGLKACGLFWLFSLWIPLGVLGWTQLWLRGMWQDSDRKGEPVMGQRCLDPLEEENLGVCSCGWGARAPEPFCQRSPSAPAWIAPPVL